MAVLCVACNSCTNTDSRITSVNSRYTINLDSIPEVQHTMLSSIFKKVKTIILETTEESLIGRISDMQVYKNYIFILDRHSSHKLYTFDTTGKFVRVIGNIGNGPGEYMYLRSFTIDPKKEEIYLLYLNKRINKYNIEGEFINAITMDGGVSNHIQYHNDKLYVDSYTDYMLKEIDPKTGKETNRFLKRDKYNKGWNESSFVSNGGGFMSKLSKSPKFRDLFTDTFIALNDNRIEPYITLQSKYLVTHSDVERVKKNEKEFSKRLAIFKEKNKIFFFKCYFETKNHIHFAYNHGYKVYTVLLDLQTQSVIKTRLFNDLVFVQNTKISLPSMLFDFSTSEGVYEWLNVQIAIEKMNFFENIKNGDLSPNLDKLEELKKLPEDSNPVIFYYSYD